MELWFNIESGGWEEISGGGEEGAEGGGKAIAYQIVGSDFVDLLTLKDMITKWVVASTTWPEGFISSVELWETKFAFEGGEKNPVW